MMSKVGFDIAMADGYPESMKRKPLTVRSDEATVSALKELSQLLGRPVNRLVNEAVTLYLANQIPAAERDLEAQLARLRAYRQADPDFEHAIEAFAVAETMHADPADGVVVSAEQPVQAEIRDLLGA